MNGDLAVVAAQLLHACGYQSEVVRVEMRALLHRSPAYRLDLVRTLRWSLRYGTKSFEILAAAWAKYPRCVDWLARLRMATDDELSVLLEEAWQQPALRPILETTHDGIVDLVLTRGTQ